MTKNIFFSIIITFYNNEKYVEKCLSSVFEQIKQNYEVIIIDDGSSDNSISIIKKYISKYNNSKLIQIDHRGVSVARNTGIKKANGKYILFIDGDDWIEKKSLGKIESFLRSNKLDILLMDTVKFYEDDNKYCYEKMTFNNLPLKEKKIYEYFIKNDVISRPWRFIVKRELINKNNLLFYPNLLHEDEEWTAKLLFDVNRISYYNGIYYYYRKHKGSITSNKTNQNYIDYLKIVKIIYKYMNSADSPHYKKYLQYSMFRCVRNVYSKYPVFDNYMKKLLDKWYYENIECYKKISKYSKYNFFLQKIFGYKKAFYYYNLTRKLLRIRRNRRREVIINEIKTSR